MLRKRNSFVVGLAVLLLLIVGVFVVMAAYPDSERGVTPLFVNDGPGGNVECGQVGTYVNESERYTNGAQFGGTEGPITWWTTDNKYVSWTGVHGGLAIIVKGGPGAHVYVYDASYEWDNQLAAPLVGGGGPNPGQVPELSNITFCWNPPPVEEDPYWCSPGFWAQNQRRLAGSAYDPAPYLNHPVPGYPQYTVGYALANPRVVRGPAFNAAANYLSGIFFDPAGTQDTGENCPINAFGVWGG